MDLQSKFFYKFISFFSSDFKFILILSTVFALYYYYTANFDFFKKKSIYYIKPKILFGNLGPWIKAKRSFHDHQVDIYNHLKGKKIGGIFEGRRPILYILDSDLIKIITIRDFDHFADKYKLVTREPAYFVKSLVNLKGSEWKGVRNKMTPAFSSARLKNMFQLQKLCASQMVEYLKQYDQKEVDMKQIMGRYTLEAIGACAFGIKYEALSKRDCHFIKVAEKFDYMSTCKRIIMFVALLFVPDLVKHLNFSFLNLESTDELVRVLQTTKAERKLTDSEENDFLQVLLDVAKKEHTEADKKIKRYMGDDIIDAQCIFFLVAGYETSSTLLSFAIHVLATKPELQDKLRAHILEMTEGKELTYELIAELGYLEGILLETLRLYPSISQIIRVVTKSYTLPDSNVKLDVGDFVAIPIYGIHMDPEYYPDPLEFRPERFMGEEKKNRPSHLFLAFGAGPRNCIGSRFTMVLAKTAMVLLIKNFKFTTCPKTENPVSFDKRSIMLKPKSGLWVRVEKL